MDIRLRIIPWLLKEDEYVGKKCEPLERQEDTAPIPAPVKIKQKNTVQQTLTTTKTSKQRTQKCPILYGTDVTKGVIKKRNNGYWAYFNDKEHPPKQKRGELSELKIKLNKFWDKGSKYETFDEIFNIAKRKSGNNWYIIQDKGKYLLRYSYEGKLYTFSTYSSEQHAIKMKNFLQNTDDPFEYLPKKMLPVNRKKFYVDDYYRTMIPILYANENKGKQY